MQRLKEIYTANDVCLPGFLRTGEAGRYVAQRSQVNHVSRSRASYGFLYCLDIANVTLHMFGARGVGFAVRDSDDMLTPFLE